MNCSAAKNVMSSYLDAAITRAEMARVVSHMGSCQACAAEFATLRRTQEAVSSLGRKVAPPDLALKLRLALSRELADSRRSRWEMLRFRWNMLFDAFMVPATGGLLSTIVIFGLLINLLVPAQFAGINDVPTTLYTPPQLQSSPFEIAIDPARPDPLIVEAYVGADGRVQDYRILSGADSAGPELKNMLIFATFQPATSFGRPIAARTILAFSRIQVKG